MEYEFDEYVDENLDFCIGWDMILGYGSFECISMLYYDDFMLF